MILRFILASFLALKLSGAVSAAAGAGAPASAPLTAEESRLMAAIDSGPDDFADDLGQAVQIDSATENLAGVRQLGELFGRQLTELGFESRFVPLPAEMNRAGHLVANHSGTQGKRILLIGHLDTVFPGANFHREGSLLSGAGVNDMKGGDVVIIHALRALHRAKLLESRRITVVMTGDEEAPVEPYAVSRRDLLEAAQRSDLVLSFEAAVGHTGTVARRGIIGWSIEVQGATGHSSGIFSDAVGSGAVFEAARILTQIYAQLKPMPGLTINPALVTGGTEATLGRTGGTATGKMNIIAQRVLLRGDLRFLSATQLAEAQAKLEAIVRDHLPRTSAELKFEGAFPAMAPTPENYALLAELDRASRDLGYPPMTAFDPRGRGAGDISFVSPPLPGLDGLGLGGTGEHTVHESSDISPANELVKRTALLIYRLTR